MHPGTSRLRRLVAPLAVSLFALLACSLPFASPAALLSQANELDGLSQSLAPTPLPLTADIFNFLSAEQPPVQPTTAVEAPPPTAAPSPTAMPSPAPDQSLPQFLVIQPMAYCRYGPGSAFLEQYELYQDDRAVILGRAESGIWLWVQPQDHDSPCWVAAYQGVSQVPVASLPPKTYQLPRTTHLASPQGVGAVRQGDEVAITWAPVDVQPPSEARGYLLEATVCQGGALVSFSMHTDGFSYTFYDETGCSNPSQGVLYAAAQDGYSDPVSIPWP